VYYETYDYLTLANIDIGNGKQACWLHATKGWNNDLTQRVIVSPIGDYLFSEQSRAVFVVIKNAGRKGLKYDLTFDIPNIPTADLPRYYDEFITA
jgi:hypothetical protein